MPPPYGHRRIGIELQPKPGDPGYVSGKSEVTEPGVRISNVLRHLPGEQGGLRNGDIILAINGKRVETVGETIAAIDALPRETQAEFRILRDGAELRLKVTPQN